MLLPGWIVVALAIPAALITAHLMAAALPAAQWVQALWMPDAGNLPQLIFHDVLLPRAVLALLCGAALGLAGVLFQQVLRNPLAEPATLGVSAGAYLAVSLEATWFPGLVVAGREAAAALGGAAAMAVVLALAWRRGLSPMALVIAGLIVSLYCAALNTTLILFNEGLRTLSLWGSGSLDVQDWAAVATVAPPLAIACVFAAMLRRSLGLLELDDVSAASLGLPLQRTRMAILAVAVLLSVAVVSAVGVIGFVGLAAPAIARLSGARSLTGRLVWSPLMGAALLWLTDALVQVVSGFGHPIPAGAATAFLGTPLLLWLLPRLRTVGLPVKDNWQTGQQRSRSGRFIVGCACLLLLAVAASLSVGRGAAGWHVSDWHQMLALAHWRGPRIAAAAAAGAMLAVAGVLLQRLTGNPMASPEILGISTGTALGIIVLALFVPGYGRPLQLAAGLTGALVSLAMVLVLGRLRGFSPDRMLLAGIALATVFSGVTSLILVSGDPRLFALLSWMSGSTYLVRPVDAIFTVGAGVVLLAVTPLTRRWLEILPLGVAASRAIGVHPTISRLSLVGLAASLTVTATLIIGPLSFMGLVAPHATRLLGFHRPLPQVAASALLGALLMVIADWLGRILLFPDQMPAGLVATLIGGGYLIALMGRRPA